MGIGIKRKLKREELKPGEILCEHCTAKCCRYFALPIEKPTDDKDFQFIRWYLLHEYASVFTEENDWYLLVHTTCKHLQSDNRCGAYHTRPQICRDYTTENCEYDDEWTYDRYYEVSEQVEEYSEAIFSGANGKSIRSPKPPLLPIVG